MELKNACWNTARLVCSQRGHKQRILFLHDVGWGNKARQARFGKYAILLHTYADGARHCAVRMPPAWCWVYATCMRTDGVWAKHPSVTGAPMGMDLAPACCAAQRHACRCKRKTRGPSLSTPRLHRLLLTSYLSKHTVCMQHHVALLCYHQ